MPKKKKTTTQKLVEVHRLAVIKVKLWILLSALVRSDRRILPGNFLFKSQVRETRDLIQVFKTTFKSLSVRVN